MENNMNPREDKIFLLIRGYCDEHLDNEYLRLCTELFDDLLDYPKTINRGKEEIWAAAIIWTIGSANFLGDKSFEPYASLSDVCSYFNANTSTVGQKASKVRDVFDIGFMNTKYQRSDSQMTNFLENLAVTEKGFIVSREPFMIDNKEIEFVEDGEEELPKNYILFLESMHPIKNVDLYQIEYLFKSILEEDEKFQRIQIADQKQVHVYFYGRQAKALIFNDKLNSKKFKVIETIDQPLTEE